mgnify:CR=1 FL=1
MIINQKIHFIHANGFPPEAYKSLFDLLNNKFSINNFLIEPSNYKKATIKKISNWTVFQKDFLDSLETNEKIIGMGHSIGGNIILRSALERPEHFSKIIILDPTLFIPRIIYMWKLTSMLGIQNKFHPWLNASLNRKMVYDNFDDIFKSYRNKPIFSKLDDDNLKLYIKSITKTDNNKIRITISREWEHQIYKTGLFADMYIWRNIKNLEIPTLILKAQDSNAFTNSTAKKIDKINNSNIRIITIENTSHLFPFEKPKQVSEKINHFII